MYILWYIQYYILVETSVMNEFLIYAFMSTHGNNDNLAIYVWMYAWEHYKEKMAIKLGAFLSIMEILKST